MGPSSHWRGDLNFSRGKAKSAGLSAGVVGKESGRQRRRSASWRQACFPPRTRADAGSGWLQAYGWQAVLHSAAVPGLGARHPQAAAVRPSDSRRATPQQGAAESSPLPDASLIASSSGHTRTALHATTVSMSHTDLAAPAECLRTRDGIPLIRLVCASDLARRRQVLAAAGVASRRASEELVFAGEVSVNGATVLQPQTPVDPQRDEVLARSAAVAPHPLSTAITLNTIVYLPLYISAGLCMRWYPMNPVADSRVCNIMSAHSCDMLSPFTALNSPTSTLPPALTPILTLAGAGAREAGLLAAAAQALLRAEQAQGLPLLQQPGLRRTRAAPPTSSQICSQTGCAR